MTYQLKIDPETEKLYQESQNKKTNKWQKTWKKSRKFVIWGAIILFIYWFYNPHGVFVLGDPLSVYHYRGVLSDLQREMPAEYDLVVKNIDQIKINYIMVGRRSGAAGMAEQTKKGTRKVVMLENTFVQGPGYAHATIVHEACHGLQYAKKLPFKPFCEHQAREHACNMWGIKVLKKFNGKPEMIKYYEDIAVGDGVYGNSCERKGVFKKMPEL